MKRIVILVIALLMFSCGKNQNNHYKTLRLYFKGVVEGDLATVKRVSTGTTYALTKNALDNKFADVSYTTFNKFAYIASKKSHIQPKIVMIRDSIFDNGNKVIIWFRLEGSHEVMKAPLILIDGTWLVDIPLLGAL